MADDILTRNAAGELAVRTTQTTGDTGTNKDDVYTRDSQGRLAVRTTGNGGGGGADYSAEIEALNNAVSVLATSVDLTTEIGGTTTVALSELTAMDIDGRPSYKQAGATVYAENGVVGIIDTVDSTNAVITTVSTSASVEKGYTWTKSQVIEQNNATSLFLNFGELSDGNYEFLVKNPFQGGATAWGMRFNVRDGNILSAFYYPLPQLVPNTKNGYATKDFPTYPIRFGVVGANVVFGGNPSYTDVVIGSVSGINEIGGVFEFTDLLNVDTGEYLPVIESSVYVEYQSPVDNIPENFRGISAYAPEIYIPNYSTGESLWFNPSDGVFRGLSLTVGFNFGNINVNDEMYYGYSPIGAMYVFLANTDMSSLVVFKVNPKLNMWSVEVVEATGMFSGVDWYCDVNSGNVMNFYPETEIIIPEGQELRGAVCSFGNSGGGFIFNYDFVREGYRGSYTPLLPLNIKLSIPTASSAGYILPHENGLVEMGGIVPIVDTLQPNVALGNVPVMFPLELANANFVPTITVMTDGTFKQVMADVANPTTTGFDLCVRNVDTEAVSNIKIAWKIVGTRK